MNGLPRVLPPLVVLLAACAQVREPQGGPKDTTAPLLVQAEPANGTTDFTGRRIVLHFDERIKLDRVRERLLISPPLEKAPEVTVSRGTDVIIDLAAPLAPNTTYTFNIGETVVDLSEGNVAAGLTYVVATGSHLDSLSVSGTVEDAFSGAPAAGVLVLLHDASDTVNVTNGRPSYFTRTDQQGRFRLTHLRAGRSHLTALRDQNADLRYDLPNEDIAFDTTAVDPTDTIPRRLFLFRPLSADQQVMEAKVLPDRGWRLVLARPSAGVDLHPLDREGGALSWWPQWSPGRDTVVLWPSDTTLLADQRFAVAEDGRAIDTLTYRITQRMPFYLTASVVTAAADQRKYLLSSRPLARIRPEHVRLRTDSTELPVILSIDTLDPRVAWPGPLPPLPKSATLELLPGALTDRYGGSNDTLRLAWGTRPATEYGELHMQVQPDSGTVISGPLVLQLLDGQGHVAREDRPTGLPFAITWHLVDPGSYTLKLIEDRDGNGRWSTGSYADRRQPERTFTQGPTVSVRANWDVEVTWEVAP